MAIRLRTSVFHQITLAVEAGNEHGAPVQIATGLAVQNRWRRALYRRAVTQALAKTAVAELISTDEEFDGIVGAEGRHAEFHGPEVFIAKRKDIGTH